MFCRKWNLIYERLEMGVFKLAEELDVDTDTVEQDLHTHTCITLFVPEEITYIEYLWHGGLAAGGTTIC